MPRSPRRRLSQRGKPFPAPAEDRQAAEQLRLARAVQEKLLPPPLARLPELELASGFLPAPSVGGDFYDCFHLHARSLALYIGDVPGRGLESVLYALVVNEILRGLPKAGSEPAELLTSLNQRLLRRRALPGKFCCLAFALVDLEQRHLVLANAGLPFPWLHRGDTVTAVEVSGLPVGLFEPCDYDQAALSLQPGDRLLFCTDGLLYGLEALSPENGDGKEQLQALLLEAADQPVAVLADRVLALLRPTEGRRQPRPLADDATFLLLRVL